MAVKIKLVRFGRKKRPSFRIIVQEGRTKVGGRIIDSLGFYDPGHNPPKLKLDKKSYDIWVKKGAKPSQSVMKILDL